MRSFVAVYLVAAIASVSPLPLDRLGYEREIDSSKYNQVPQLLVDYIISPEYLAAMKNRGKLITKPLTDTAVAEDNVLLESNVVKVLPVKRKAEAPEELVRKRRGYNLENVRVPARYPYLPVPRYDRFRRWGYYY